MQRKILIALAILLCITNTIYAAEKHPDYAEIYMGKDKFENYNRKMFAFNMGLNKYAIKPLHKVWASVMPQYGMDRIQSAYKNIEYPKRVISCLIQKDFEGSKDETVRFLTNTTIGLGGMFDPAKRFLKINPVDEDIEQALSKCKVNSGPYLILPILAPSSPRNAVGRLVDTALNPTTYIATPVLAMVKAGLTVNRTSFYQPLIKMVESNYADPYDVAKKLYGLERHIKCANLDRKEVLDTAIEKVDISDETVFNDPEKILDNKNLNNPDETLTVAEIIKGGTSIGDIVLKNYNLDNSKLYADLILFDYNPQNPIVDAMRTALFDLPELNKSIWSDLSIWNRSFAKRIKTSSVNIFPDKDNYTFKYILQKDKTAPLAIIYPSIGEGVTSHHSVVLAKIFYEEGYSVIIQGSPFQWEFVKSMPDDYHPGIAPEDTDYLKTVTTKILKSLTAKYDIQPREKVFFGTSFGAMTALFLADKEYKNNTLGETKYIAVCPPIELMYAMKQVDKNTENWQTDDFKNKTAITAAKVLQIYNSKDKGEQKINSLPFTEYEGKLITGFIMHQKLSDLIFTIENTAKCKKCCDFYKNINNISYSDYAEHYLMNDRYKTVDDLNYDTSLHSIAEYLQANNNYKIYHSLDDYMTNTQQLKLLKQYSGKNTILLSNGSHLGFLYRQEFQNALRKYISQNSKY